MFFRALMIALCCGCSIEGQKADPRNDPVEPFRVIANIHYVGSTGLSSYLITTPRGHILIDTGFEETVPVIRNSVRKLGFKFEDIKIILCSHAHIDHVAGHALARELSGAQVMAMAGDAEVISTGGKGDFRWEGEYAWKPCKVARVLQDGDTVELEQVRLKAHLTPGHSKGCTTWTTTVEEGGRKYNVVWVGGTSINPGVKVSSMPKYPNIAEEYARTFKILKSLSCDVFLAQHPPIFSMHEKLRRIAEGEKANPFVDPHGYRTAIEQQERIYLEQLQRERSGQ